jgi:hypothetical protein
MCKAAVCFMNNLLLRGLPKMSTLSLSNKKGFIIVVMVKN